MQHITPERIAALADEPATLIERTHLAECAACNAELAAAQRLVRMALTETPAIGHPVTAWDRLSPALLAEGLIQTPMSGHERGRVVESLSARRASRRRWMMQAAAGVFLAAGGAVVGRASAGLPVGTVASNAAFTANDTGFRSIADAQGVLDRASDEAQRAIAYLAATDSNVTMRGRDAAAAYAARLEVFDQAAANARAALFRAPQDPVLNNYYLSTMAQRDLTLRQLGGVVPASSTTRTRF